MARPTAGPASFAEGRVERHDAPQVLAGNDRLDLRVPEACSASAAADAAVEHDVGLGRQPLGEPRLVEPGDRERPRGVDQLGLEHRAPPAQAPRAQIAQPPRDLDHLADAHLGHRRAAAPVLPGSGQMPEQRADRGGAGLPQRGRPARADAGKNRDRGGRRDAAGTRRRRTGGGADRGRGAPLGAAHSPRKPSLTSPNCSSSPGWTSTGTPVSTRSPLTKVPFIVPISSQTKNFSLRR